MNIRQKIATLNTRQKIIAGVVVLIVLVLLYIGIGMLGGGSSTTPPPTFGESKPPVVSAMSPNNAQGPQMPSMSAQPPQPTMPTPAQLLKTTPEMTQRESELMQLQQETQKKYLEALNELQLLKLSLQLAETNSAIMKAKLDTIVSQKGIVDLLTKPTTPTTGASYSQSLGGNAPPPPPTQNSTVMGPPSEASYTVISVSQLQYKWAAVLGFQGSLYSVAVGDVLPADGSTVIAIDKSGVILERNGTRRKVSLVPII